MYTRINEVKADFPIIRQTLTSDKNQYFTIYKWNLLAGMDGFLSKKKLNPVL